MVRSFSLLAVLALASGACDQRERASKAKSRPTPETDRVAEEPSRPTAAPDRPVIDLAKHGIAAVVTVPSGTDVDAEPKRDKTPPVVSLYVGGRQERREASPGETNTLVRTDIVAGEFQVDLLGRGVGSGECNLESYQNDLRTPEFHAQAKLIAELRTSKSSNGYVSVAKFADKDEATYFLVGGCRGGILCYARTRVEKHATNAASVCESLTPSD